jgi:hypothetical protein
MKKDFKIDGLQEERERNTEKEKVSSIKHVQASNT